MDKTIEELLYQHKGNYKGWVCDFTGCGVVSFTNSAGKTIEARRGEEVKNWVEECWFEIKSKIDILGE